MNEPHPENYIASNDSQIHQQAFDNSLQPNILTTAGNGKIIIVNTAACKLLGYAKKALLTKSRSDIFDINESSFKKMLKQRRADGKSAALVTAIKKNGKRIPCEITSAVFMGDDGIEKAITTIADMSQSILKQKKIDIENKKIVSGNIILAKSRQKSIDIKKEKIVAGNIVLAKSKQKNIDVKKEKMVADNIILAQAKTDTKLEENNKWLKYIAKTSYDVMWDWNIASGEIYVGDSVQEVFGYKLKNNTVHFSAFKKRLLPEERTVFEKKLLKALASSAKSWNASYRFKRYDGSVAAATSRAGIIRNEEGKAIRLIGATQDISQLQELEKKLNYQVAIGEGLSETFQLLTKLSFAGIWEWNLLNGQFHLSEGFEKLFGYALKDAAGDIKLDWSRHLHPDDKADVEKDLHEAVASHVLYWEKTYRFLRANGTIAKVSTRAGIMRDKDGKAYCVIAVMQDITRQKNLERRLKNEIQLKEKQIADATEDAKDAERSDIGRELHDNVNQLLGVSKLYVDMAKRGGENSEMYLSRSSEYTLKAIEEIRKITKALTTDTIRNMGLREAIENAVRDTMDVSPVKIAFTLRSFIENSVNDKFKLNVFRIIQEQLNNILKHARATKVSISLLQNKRSIKLTITDNGIGFDSNKKRPGIGLYNISSRVKSFNGTAEIASQSGQGFTLSVVFPVSEALLNKPVNQASQGRQ